MSHFLIGDIQGCHGALVSLLEKISFSPSRDTLFVLGDLVNRGPNNVASLELLSSLGNSAQCLLGNHDLNFLSIHHGVRTIKKGDTIQDILNSPDRQRMIDWLRHQHMALQWESILMVHAGVLPQWSAEQTLELAKEVTTVLQSLQLKEFLPHMYGNSSNQWSEALTGHERLRVIINALTRLRFCTAQGVMEFDTKVGLNTTPEGFMPWFDVPNRQTKNNIVAFGHWSALGWLNRSDVWCLDSGCVWGRTLTALKVNPSDQSFEKIEVSCADQITIAA